MSDRTVATSAQAMIGGMTPVLDPTFYIFATITDAVQRDRLLPMSQASIHEAEGLSLILTQARATAAGLPLGPAMRCITLNVFSDLEGVGLTAAVAAALAAQGIPCNMVAGFHHDHVFVPADRAEDALNMLLALQARA